MSEARAQRLIDEFNEGAASTGGHSVRHGIARVLQHLCDTEADEESFYAIPQDRLERLIAALTAPTLLDCAMAGGAASARQFLCDEVQQQMDFLDRLGVKYNTLLLGQAAKRQQLAAQRKRDYVGDIFTIEGPIKPKHYFMGFPVQILTDPADQWTVRLVELPTP